MNQHDFMEMVIRECEVCSLKTYTFSKRKYRKFKRWFFRKGKKIYGWSKWKCNFEFEQFASAFNLRIK